MIMESQRGLIPTSITRSPMRESEKLRFVGYSLIFLALTFSLLLGSFHSAQAADPNTAPVANGDSYGTNEDVLLSITAPEGVLANDQDADGEPLQAHLAADPFYGDLSLSLDGSFVYTPSQDFAGLDLFQYQASDGISATEPVWVWLNVNPVNDPPTAVGDEYDTDEDVVLTVSAPGVLSNDSDVEGDTISAHLLTGPSHGTVGLNIDGSLLYTPTQDFNGSDQITYYASDGQLESLPVTVTINIAAVNDLATTNSDFYRTDEDTTLHVAAPGILGNDTDAEGESLSAQLVTGPEFGELSLNADGSFIYTPTADHNGYTVWYYTANDGHGASAPKAVYVIIKPVNDFIPVAVDDSYSTQEDAQLTVADPGVLGNDSDGDGDRLQTWLAEDPVHGTLYLRKYGGFTYTPDPDFNGVDHFTYRASDKTAKSPTATVTITVSSVNDVPQAVDDAYQTPQDTELAIAAPGVIENDSDADGDSISASVVNWPQHGWILFRPDGSFTYFPYTGYSGDDSFTYRVWDGSAWSTLATVSLDVKNNNRAPEAFSDQYSTNEDVILSVLPLGVLNNDADADNDPLTAILMSGASHGELTLSADGSFVYTPSANYHGQDLFSYQASDGISTTATVSASITVEPINDAPVAQDDQFPATPEDKPLSIDAPGVLANDSDAEQSQLTATVISGPAHGTLSLDPNGSVRLYARQQLQWQ